MSERAGRQAGLRIMKNDEDKQMIIWRIMTNDEDKNKDSVEDHEIDDFLKT